MTIDLDAFVNKAISDVRNAKATGKKGRMARKSLGAGQKFLTETEQKLEKMKLDIKEYAKACESKQWKPTRLILYIFTAKCKCCGRETHAHPEAIYLETTHKTLGTIQRRQDEIQINSYPGLPREIYEKPVESFICIDCFASWDFKQTAFDFMEDKPISINCRPTYPKSKELYAKLSDQYNKQERMKCLRRYLPKTLLLPNLSKVH